MNTPHNYILILIGLVSVFGCGSQSKLSEPQQVWETATDDIGRVVKFAQPPTRIISLAPANTELLYAIGAEDRLVGVTTYCNYPEVAQAREKVGGFLSSSISREKILGLRPDLVLASRAHAEVVEDMAEFGIPTLVIEPQRLDGIFEAIESLGRVTDCNEAAGALLADMRRRLDRLRQHVATVENSDRPTVFYQVWDNPLQTAGKGSFIDQLIREAGGRNAFGDLENPFPNVSEESLLSRNPAVIIAPATGSRAALLTKMQQRAGWSSLSAVANERVYFVDEDVISRTGPRVIDALEQIAESLHPNIDFNLAPATPGSAVER